MVGKIEARYGADVYVSETGKVCIKQDQGAGEDLILIFDDGEIGPLIDLLQQARTEIAEERRVDEENESN